MVSLEAALAGYGYFYEPFRKLSYPLIIALSGNINQISTGTCPEAKQNNRVFS